MTELESVRNLRSQYPDELKGLMLAEMDWLNELHLELYELEDGF